MPSSRAGSAGGPGHHAGVSRRARYRAADRQHLYRLDLPPPPASRSCAAPAPGPSGWTRRERPDPARGRDGRDRHELRATGVESVAVSLLHAYANPAHEQRSARSGAALPLLSVSSEINAEFREYERAHHGAQRVGHAARHRYLDDLRARLPGCAPASAALGGGMMSVEAAARRPLTMAMSGPAAGVAAAAHTARALGIGRALGFDMGGTTTDVCLIAGGARRSPQNQARRPPGAAAHARRRVDRRRWRLAGGVRHRRPVDGPGQRGRRARAGGLWPRRHAPTVTDANVVLGYLDPTRLYGGSIPLDVATAEAALAPIAQRFGRRLIELAAGVQRVANASMLRALRLVSVQRGFDLAGFAPSSPMAARDRCTPARSRGRPASRGSWCPRIPASPRSAVSSPLRYDPQTYRAPAEPRWSRIVSARSSECMRPLLGAAGAPWPRPRAIASSGPHCRYAGQNYELKLPFGDRRPAPAGRPSSSGTGSSTAMPPASVASA